MSLLGEYLNTYQRANPAQGLMQGFQTGSNFMFARNQQKMQQEQIKQQEAEREKQGDMKMVSVLFDAAPKMQSKAMRAQTIQRAYDILGKYNENLRGVVVDPSDDSFNEFVSKARRFKQPLIDNPDAALKDLDAFLEEMAAAKDEGGVEDKQYKDIIDTVTGVKKEAAGELGGRVFTAYQTPEATADIEGYQNTKYSQMTALGEGDLAVRLKGAQNRDRALPAKQQLTPNQALSDFNSHIGRRQQLVTQLARAYAGYDPLTQKPLPPELLQPQIETLEEARAQEEAYLESEHPQRFMTYLKSGEQHREQREKIRPVEIQVNTLRGEGFGPKEIKRIQAGKGSPVTFENGPVRRTFLWKNGKAYEVPQQ